MLQSMGSQRVGHDLATATFIFYNFEKNPFMDEKKM